MNLQFDMSLVPEVIYDDRPEYLGLYRKAWELASDHVLDTAGLPVVHHIDEGFAPDRLWIWDTCFMVHFCKYSPGFFPGIQSLDNFYLPIHDSAPSSCLIQHLDNPPLFAWTEYEYYRFTGDRSRIHRNLVQKCYLQKHYRLLESLKIGQRFDHSFLLNTLQKNECGYFWSGIASGMDNTPRGEDAQANLYWLDILSQQALSALYIAKMAGEIGETAIAEEYGACYQEKSALLNQYYYDEVDGSYYDIYAATHDVCRVLTPASFWPLLAEVADDTQARRQIATLLDAHKLGGEFPVPSVARDSKYFIPDGRYWRGGVWLPTSYMVIKSLEKYGYFDLAAEIAERTLCRMYEVYARYLPATIWEAYAPSQFTPAASKMSNKVARPDFCGWSALGPISLLIENIIGIRKADAVTGVLCYHHRNIGRHGIKNLKFGKYCCSLIADQGNVKFECNHPVTLDINGKKYQCAAGSHLLTPGQ